jgi:hypothetical protein
VTVLEQWFAAHVTPLSSAPLFDAEGLAVRTFQQGEFTKLRRHPDFDRLMIATVEEGLVHEDWQGFVYVLYRPTTAGPVPLYIGKAERRGVTRELSANLENISRNRQKFGRWGYARYYHIGDLSHAMFGGPTKKKPERKYHRWAASLFVDVDPPTLRAPVRVALISWYAGMHGPSGLVGTVATVEKELIALASAAFPQDLLNVDGR